MPKLKKGKTTNEESKEEMDKYEEETDPELDEALMDGLLEDDGDSGIDGLLSKLDEDTDDEGF